jgi:hypothetical protein
MFPAVVIGGLFPITLPLVLLVLGAPAGSARTRLAGWAVDLAIGYALYVGIGVSMAIHWLSNFVAGAILGTVIGGVVGESFLRHNGPGVVRDR